MFINYSNNSKPSFGSFNFTYSAQKFIDRTLKTPEQINKFNELCKLENTGIRKNRKITVTSLLRLDGSIERLASPIKNRWYKQGIFQSPLTYLEKLIKKTDKLQNQ